MKPAIETPSVVMSCQEFAQLTGQRATTIRAQITAGTCPVDVVLLRRADPVRGSKPRYGLLRASVDKLLEGDTP